MILREIGNRRGEGADLGNLGAAYAALGQVEKAVGLLQQALAIGREVKDPWLIQFASNALQQLGAEDAALHPG